MEKVDAAQRHLFDTMSLAAGGEALLNSLTADDTPEPLRALIIEAARTKDRLDKLDLVLRGDVDVWIRLTETTEGMVELRIDSVLAESRQQGAALLRLLTEIHKQKAPAGNDDDDGLKDL